MLRSPRALLAAGAAALIVAGCGAGDGTDAPPTTPATSPAPAGTTPVEETAGEDSPSPTPEATEEAGVRAEFTVSDGAVDGPGRVEVAQGEMVVLVVTSDVDDEVHVHGYDILADVAAGETVTLEFAADVPGVFEVEMEERHLKLTDLQVGG